MNQAEFDKQLAEHFGSFYNDPLGFVMFAYPWGVKGTPLENHTGPDKWHLELFKQLTEHVTGNMARKDAGLDLEPWASAIVSGHGVGKSAVVAWLIQWLMATRYNCRGAVTANTESQLEKKTWPELAKWHSMFIAKHWFVWTSTQYYYALCPPEERKNYCIDAIPWSEERTEGFAGLHNETSAVVVIFDEASAIADKLWEVAEGAMTDGEPFMFAFGNGTRPYGRFYECFNKFREFWRKFHVDSRFVRITNKLVLQKIIDKYGEDSDEARVRVKGQFPKGSANGYIKAEETDIAIHRELVPDFDAPLILAVDVARYGDDKTVLRWRKGPDARSIKPRHYHGLDTQQVADKVAEAIDETDPDATIIEGSGVGGGVVDALKRMNYRVIEVNPGRVARNKTDYFNVRAEMHGELKEWLRNSGCINDEPDLVADLTKVEYRYNDKNQLILESKKDMKDRGLPSPDDGDSLALTFSARVSRLDAVARRSNRRRKTTGPVKGTHYDLG